MLKSMICDMVSRLKSKSVSMVISHQGHLVGPEVYGSRSGCKRS